MLQRTTRTRNCVSRPTFLGQAFKLIEEAEKTRRRISGQEQPCALLVALRGIGDEPERRAGIEVDVCALQASPQSYDGRVFAAAVELGASPKASGTQEGLSARRYRLLLMPASHERADAAGGSVLREHQHSWHIDADSRLPPRPRDGKSLSFFGRTFNFMVPAGAGRFCSCAESCCRWWL